MITAILKTAPCLLLLSIACARVSSPDKDYLEMERVWQYLRTYSIYQDRVPEHPFEGFSTPSDLTAAIHDTLKSGNPFTRYIPSGDPGIEAVFGQSGRFSSTNKDEPYKQWNTTTGVLTIRDFNETTFEQLKSITADEPNLIVNLRNNPGGLLDVLDSCMELFLPAGTPYIQQISRRYDENEKRAYTQTITKRTVSTGDKFEGKKIAVIIDTGTASAAEIMAAGLRDGLPDSMITLVGTHNTFGKAIGQYYKQLVSGAVISITAFRFYRIIKDDTGANKDYLLTGIEPDIRVSSDNDVNPVVQSFFGKRSSAVEVASPLSEYFAPTLGLGAYAILTTDLPPLPKSAFR